MYHLATGMSLVLQVGEDGDWPPVPRNFPRCGNYLPTPYLEDYGNTSGLSSKSPLPFVPTTTKGFIKSAVNNVLGFLG
jgi:hypothetical protein